MVPSEAQVASHPEILQASWPVLFMMLVMLQAIVCVGGWGLIALASDCPPVPDLYARHRMATYQDIKAINVS